MKIDFRIIQTPYLLVQDENNPHNGKIALVLGIKTVTPNESEDYHCLSVKYPDGEKEYIPLQEIIGVAENPRYRLLSSQEVSEFNKKNTQTVSS